jgi:hypothetical protein
MHPLLLPSRGKFSCLHARARCPTACLPPLHLPVRLRLPAWAAHPLQNVIMDVSPVRQLQSRSAQLLLLLVVVVEHPLLLRLLLAATAAAAPARRLHRQLGG